MGSQQYFFEHKSLKGLIEIPFFTVLAMNLFYQHGLVDSFCAWKQSISCSEIQVEVTLKLSDGWCFIFTLLLWCFGPSQKKEKKKMDLSKDLLRKRQVTPGDHLEDVGGEKSFYTPWLGRGMMSETESCPRSREMATESREQRYNWA